MGKSDENLFDTFSKSKSLNKNLKKVNQKKTGFGKGGVYDSDLDSDKSYESGESGEYQSKPVPKVPSIEKPSVQKIQKTQTSNNNASNYYETKKQPTTIVRKPLTKNEVPKKVVTVTKWTAEPPEPEKKKMGRGFLVSVESGEKKIGNVGRQYSNTFESLNVKKNDDADDYSSNQSNSRSDDSRSDSRDSRDSSYSSYSQDSSDQKNVRNGRDAENNRDVKNDRNDRDVKNDRNDRDNDIYTEESSESDYERVDRKPKEPEVVAGVQVDDAKPVDKVGSKGQKGSIENALDQEQFVDHESSDDYDRKDLEQDRKNKKEQDKRDSLEKKDGSKLKKKDTKDSKQKKSKKGQTATPEKYEPQLSYRNSDEYTRKATETSIPDSPTLAEPARLIQQDFKPPAEKYNTSIKKDEYHSPTSTEPQTLAQNTPQLVSQIIPTEPQPETQAQPQPETQAQPDETQGLHINLKAISPKILYHSEHTADAQEPYQQNYSNNNNEVCWDLSQQTNQVGKPSESLNQTCQGPNQTDGLLPPLDYAGQGNYEYDYSRYQDAGRTPQTQPMPPTAQHGQTGPDGIYRYQPQAEAYDRSYQSAQGNPQYAAQDLNRAHEGYENYQQVPQPNLQQQRPGYGPPPPPQMMQHHGPPGAQGHHPQPMYHGPPRPPSHQIPQGPPMGPGPHGVPAFHGANTALQPNYLGGPPPRYAAPEMRPDNYYYDNRPPGAPQPPPGYDQVHYPRDMGLRPAPPGPDYQFHQPGQRSQGMPPGPPRPMPPFRAGPPGPQMGHPQQMRQSMPPPMYGVPPRNDLPSYETGHMSNPNVNYLRKYDSMHESMPARDPREMHPGMPPPRHPGAMLMNPNHGPSQHQDFAPPPQQQHGQQNPNMFRGGDPYGPQHGFPPRDPGMMRQPQGPAPHPQMG